MLLMSGRGARVRGGESVRFTFFSPPELISISRNFWPFLLFFLFSPDKFFFSRRSWVDFIVLGWPTHYQIPPHLKKKNTWRYQYTYDGGDFGVGGGCVCAGFVARFFFFFATIFFLNEINKINNNNNNLTCILRRSITNTSR